MSALLAAQRAARAFGGSTSVVAQIQDLRFFVVTFFVGLAAFGWLVVWAVWALAAGQHRRAASRRDVDATIEHSRPGGWVLAAAVATLVGAGAVGTYVADAAEDSYGCGRDLAPVSRRRAIDPAKYEQANLALIQAIPQFASTQLADLTSRETRRCPDTTGDIVAVTTSFSIDPLAAGKCAYIESLEADLRIAGWRVHAAETQSPNGEGWLRATHAERGNERLELSIDGLGRRLLVSVDHDSEHGGQLPADFPSMACT
jgi:hypothetical protein